METKRFHHFHDFFALSPNTSPTLIQTSKQLVIQSSRTVQCTAHTKTVIDEQLDEKFLNGLLYCANLLLDL